MNDNKLQTPMTEESISNSAQTLGQTIKAFICEGTNQLDIHFDALKGYQVVLFFYPQNGLPGVTQLAKDFASQYESFKHIQTCVFGVSIESIQANQEFKDSLDLPFPLIADTSHELSQWFNTLTTRTIFGDPITTVEQSTFLLNSEGKVVKTWVGEEVRGHASQVMEAAHKASEGFDHSALELQLKDEPAVPHTKETELLAAKLAEAFDI